MNPYALGITAARKEPKKRKKKKKRKKRKKREEMALTAAQKQKVTGAIQGAASSVWQEFTLNNVDLYNAVDAAGDWISDNQGGYNTALPLPFRTNATAAQKSLVFMSVAMALYFLDDADARQVLSVIVAELNKMGG